MNFKQHPLSSAFPQMAKTELDALTDDIAMEGQREPITLFEGMILDGWHRYLSCQACGRVPNMVMLASGIDPISWVKSKNLHRRHLTASQRAIATVKCAEWKKSGDNQHTIGAVPGTGPLSVKEMAQSAEVSEKTIQQAKKAHEAGLGEKVRDGEFSAKKAAEIADPPKPKETPMPGAAVPPIPPSVPPGKILVEQSQWRQLQLDLAETIADNEAMGKVIDADDKLKVAMAEVKKKQSRIDALEMRLKGIMNEKNAAVSKVKSLEKALAKVESQVRKQCPGMEG